MIEKKPINDDYHIRRFLFFLKARHALAWFLRYLGARAGDLMLMPAYIGWSPREGSGVFDPIREAGLIPVFFHLDRELSIDTDDFLEKLNNNSIRYALIIHYFGFVDRSYIELVSTLRSKGVVAIEDSAHALLTDLIGCGCGSAGDASIFSLHKLLPLDSGGLLAIRRDFPINRIAWPNDLGLYSGISPWEYDLEAISQIRRTNYEYLLSKMNRLDRWVKPLHPVLKINEVPHNFPLRIISGSRDAIYDRMNAAGFGVVSLYHTLIREIDPTVFEAEAALSRSILNLPIHQDVNPGLIDRMVEALESVFMKREM